MKGCIKREESVCCMTGMGGVGLGEEGVAGPAMRGLRKHGFCSRPLEGDSKETSAGDS
jgi:hypothetical protein